MKPSVLFNRTNKGLTKDGPWLTRKVQLKLALSQNPEKIKSWTPKILNYSKTRKTQNLEFLTKHSASKLDLAGLKSKSLADSEIIK